MNDDKTLDANLGTRIPKALLDEVRAYAETLGEGRRAQSQAVRILLRAGLKAVGHHSSPVTEKIASVVKEVTGGGAANSGNQANRKTGKGKRGRNR